MQDISYNKNKEEERAKNDQFKDWRVGANYKLKKHLGEGSFG